jgi:hypothetical protein
MRVADWKEFTVGEWVVINLRAANATNVSTGLAPNIVQIGRREISRFSPAPSDKTAAKSTGFPSPSPIGV